MLTRWFPLTALILVAASLCRSREISDDLTRQPSSKRLLSHLHPNRLPSKVSPLELSRTGSHVPPLIEELLKSYPKHQLRKRPSFWKRSGFEETDLLWKLGNIGRQTAKRAPFWKRADELVKRTPFWKRKVSLVPRARFWKRSDAMEKRPSFWKRQSLSIKRAPFWKRRVSMKRPSFWKRSQQSDKRAPFWKRGQSMKRAPFWKRRHFKNNWIGTGLEDDSLISSKRAPFWKRSGGAEQPLSLVSEKRPSFWKRAPFWKRVDLDDRELLVDRSQKQDS